MNALSIYWNGVLSDMQRSIRSATEQKLKSGETAATVKADRTPRPLGYSVLRSGWVNGRPA